MSLDHQFQQKLGNLVQTQNSEKAKKTSVYVLCDKTPKLDYKSNQKVSFINKICSEQQQLLQQAKKIENQKSGKIENNLIKDQKNQHLIKTIHQSQHVQQKANQNEKKKRFRFKPFNEEEQRKYIECINKLKQKINFATKYIPSTVYEMMEQLFKQGTNLNRSASEIKKHHQNLIYEYKTVDKLIQYVLRNLENPKQNQQNKNKKFSGLHNLTTLNLQYEQLKYILQKHGEDFLTQQKQGKIDQNLKIPHKEIKIVYKIPMRVNNYSKNSKNKKK